MEDENIILKDKIVLDTKTDKKGITIYFTDGTVLEVWGVDRLHSGTGITCKITQST